MERSESILSQRARERQAKKNEMRDERASNPQQYVQRLSENAAPPTVGASNRALPNPQEKQSSSKLVQEMQRMTARLDNTTEKNQDKARDARQDRENDLNRKGQERNQQQNNQNFAALNNVFKNKGDKIVQAVEDLTREFKRAQKQSQNAGGGPSLLDQLQEMRKNKNKRGGSGSRGGGGDEFDIEGFDDPHTTAEDRKAAKRARRMRRIRNARGGRGLKGMWNRARGFGSTVLEKGGEVLNAGESLASKIPGGTTALKVLGHVGTVASMAESAYTAAPLIGKVFDSDADTADRVGAGAHLAVQGAGGVIGGVLGGPMGAAIGLQIGDAVANVAETVGQKIADNVDVYGAINDKDGIVHKTMDGASELATALVDSDVGKTMGRVAAIAMSPFSEEARDALKKDWQQEILPAFSDKFETLTNTLGNYGSALSKAGGQLLDGLKNSGSNIVDGFKDAGNQIANGYRRKGIAGALEAVTGTASKVGSGFGRAWDSAKEGVSSAGSSLRYGAQKGTASSLDLALGFSAKKGFKGMSDSESKAYAATVMKTESGGALGIENQYGFAGQYQFGADALADNGLIDKDKLQAAKAAAKANGKDWYKDGLHKQFMADNSNWTNDGGHDAFMKDKQLQDDTFVQYTNKNIDAGYRSGALTAKSTPAEIAAYAKAAHLKGSGGANDWFLRGQDSTDANGMKVSTYAADAQNNIGDLAAQVDSAKAKGALTAKVVPQSAATAADAKLDAKKVAVAGQITASKTDAQKTASLKDQMASSKGPTRTKTTNAANAKREDGAQATATPLAADTSINSNTSTASASAQPMAMVDSSTPAEAQRVVVTNPTPQSEPSKTTVVSAGGGGGSGNMPTLDEIPMIINDMGLVLLNTGHV